MSTLVRSASALSLATLLSPGLALAQGTDVTVDVGGRVMIDYTVADIDNPAAGLPDDISASEVRRARIFLKGKYGSRIDYKVEFEGAGGDVELTDAYLQFKPVDGPLKIKVGQFNTHNSLDELTSSRFSSTIERAAFTDAFGFQRRLGVAVATSGSNYTLDAGLFGTNIQSDGGPDEGMAASARATFNPVKTDDTLVHLGASWRYREAGDTEGDLRYRQRPYTHASPFRIINTGRFADSDNLIGVEAAGMVGSAWAAGEYALLGADGAGAAQDGDFDAFYAEVGYFFGGRRGYKGGKFVRPTVDAPLGSGGLGAISVVARYDSIDLEDGPYLGTLDTVVLGADWWPTAYTKLRLNYFNADAENGVADSAEGFVARLGFDF